MATHESRRVNHDEATGDAATRRERLEASVRGAVQGVGFRWFVVRQAAQLGLVGWTSNEADGSVRVIAEGSSQALVKLEQLLRDGPPGAHVQALDAARVPATGEFTTFGIRSGAHSGD
jgi:acylphosphatase